MYPFDEVSNVTFEWKRYAILTPSKEYSTNLAIAYTADTIEEIEQHIKEDYGYLRLYQDVIVVERLPTKFKVVAEVKT